ncbi:hypothetical protein VOLCADRAFT_103876 [Volvox carteri f. nagariensis]|uniref:Uncharacterized protein n=1 Tax=Volvox carteri f. nagariensis TaxID=3068 RepID=D8TPT5_VOLCA|nr:uncharacterized protein VOLCADRAFT_103876 [Volvox carteri f. nagariensis]EFJ50414.1 hypothetical protein VOLCADRAFT_103876 [Volvox carteri f. nagariensis]|eukprot:XP_002948539.1 hypothetical protein VOLCADRAFT_103876 [Volvox carteri f. nagariensis]
MFFKYLFSPRDCEEGGNGNGWRNGDWLFGARSPIEVGSSFNPIREKGKIWQQFPIRKGISQSCLEMLGGWPEHITSSEAFKRTTSHVNPLPARKPSKRAKYGDVAEVNKARRLARSPKPPVIRPRPKRAAETSSSPSLPSSSTSRLPAPNIASSSSTTLEPSGPAGFRRRRKLFLDSPDGPHPRMTAKIVARLAACKDWRRQLAHKLLPRYLPLFDQHAAAYFFKHVPSLQPRAPPLVPPSVTAPAWMAEPSGVAASRGGAAASAASAASAATAAITASRDAAGFRRMVVAVCSSLLPKMPSFGPRALTCMISGLGRMGIRQVDKFVVATAGAGSGIRRRTGQRRRQRQRQRRTPPLLPPLGEAWRQAALGAAHSALPRMTVAEIGQMLMALAALRLRPPLELLDATCIVVRNAVAEEAARLALVHTAAAGSAARRAAAAHRYGMTSASAGAVGVLAAAVSAEAAAAESGLSPDGKKLPKAKFGRAAAAPPPREPLYGADVARVVRGLGALGYAPSPEWITWILSNVAAVIRGDVARSLGWRRRQQQQKQLVQHVVPSGAGGGHTLVAATATLSAAAGAAGRQHSSGADAAEPWSGSAAAAAAGAAATAAAMVAPLPPPYFSAEDISVLLTGLADMVPAMMKSGSAEGSAERDPAVRRPATMMPSRHGVASLRAVAAALGALPYIVPDLRYLAEYEIEALQSSPVAAAAGGAATANTAEAAAAIAPTAIHPASELGAGAGTTLSAAATAGVKAASTGPREAAAVKLLPALELCEVDDLTEQQQQQQQQQQDGFPGSCGLLRTIAYDSVWNRERLDVYHLHGSDGNDDDGYGNLAAALSQHTCSQFELYSI